MEQMEPMPDPWLGKPDMGQIKPPCPVAGSLGQCISWTTAQSTPVPGHITSEIPVGHPRGDDG